MPTNANTFNSRVTSEALEKKFRDTFPAQGGAELIQDLYAQGTIVPVVDFTAAAEGSALRGDLQEAWDFSTGHLNIVAGGSNDVITTPGFWLVDLTYSGLAAITSSSRVTAQVNIYDGATAKVVWAQTNSINSANNELQAIVEAKFVVYLRSGDSLRARIQSANYAMDIWYRQIADVYGNLTQPLGYVAQ